MTPPAAATSRDHVTSYGAVWVVGHEANALLEADSNHDIPRLPVTLSEQRFFSVREQTLMTSAGWLSGPLLMKLKNSCCLF